MKTETVHFPIVEKYNNYFRSKIEVWPQYKNRASSAGHPCERHLVYCRLNWKEKEKHGLETELIFKEGRHQEKAFVQDCMEAGIEVHESQRGFSWDKYEVTGRIDGTIATIPFEFKSMSPFQWEKINSVEDIKTSDRYYVRGYFDQLQLYLLMMDKEIGVLIFKNKINGQLKQFDISLDYEYAENLIKKLERINVCVKKQEYPERIDDRSVCKMCAFKSLCLPNEGWEQVKIVSDDELLVMLEKRELLKPVANEYSKLDKKVKEQIPEEAGEYLYGGKFAVTKKAYKTTVYEIPKDVKDQYAEKKERFKTSIVNLEDKPNDSD